VIAVLDYGMGNLRSVQKALEHVGAEVEVTYDADRIRAAAGLVLPGVGAFPKAMQAVHERGLDELIHQRSDAGVPILGICLGMQLLFDSSVELGGADGLGLLEGEVRALDAPGLKIPQIGWNEVEWMRESAINAALPGDRTAFYHVHSFAPVAGNGVVLGRADYGSSFVSAVAGDGIFGVQFHPEKSGPDGLTLLSGFAALTA
jgi:glutamine amidotransferase